MQLYLIVMVGIIIVSLYLLVRPRTRSQEIADEPLPFPQREAREGMSKKVLDEIKTSFKIDPPLGSRQVHIMFVETTGISEVRIGLRVSNPTPYEVTVERVVWELWLGKLLKYSNFTTPTVLSPQTISREIVIQEVLSEEEAAAAARGQQGLDVNCYLEGTCYCKTAHGLFDKKFVSFRVSYEMVGRLVPRTPPVDMLSHVDSLTGLLQRRFLEEHLQSIVDATVGRHPLSFIMIDVDRFKEINDRYGHLVGDEIIRTVCAQIKDIIGDKGLAVRYGGDEFSIVLEFYESHEAELLAQRLLSAVEQCQFSVPFGEPLKITLSIGVATLRQPADYRLLIKKADDMLLRSKKDGRNRVTVDRMDRRRA